MPPTVEDARTGAYLPTQALDQVEAWRYECLVTAGADDFSAQVMATSTRVDLHRAVQLLEAGATGEQAVRILL